MTQVEVIKKFMASLDTDPTNDSIAALDTAIQSCSSFTGLQDAINHMVKDCKNAKNWKTFLSKKCGIDLENEDVGGITGADAGGDVVKTADSIVPEEGSLLTYKKKSFTANGLTFTLNKSYSKLATDEKFVWNGLHAWWAEESLNLIEESYGYSFEDKDVWANDILVKFYSDADDGTLAYVGTSWTDDDQLKLTLNVNMGIFSNLDKKNKNGVSKDDTETYLDRTLAHELTHAIMAAKEESYHYEMPIFVCEGLAELTCGIDDERYDEIKDLAKSSTKLKKYLATGKTSSDSTYDYAAGYMFFRYLAKQSESDDPDPIDNDEDNVIVSGTSGADTIYNSGSNVEIKAGKGNDSIVSYYKNDSDVVVKDVIILGGAGNDTIDTASDDVSVDGGAGNDYIVSVSANSTIKGGAGNDSLIGSTEIENDDYFLGGDGADTLSGGTGKDTLTGGNGKDVFIYSGGNDIITDYKAGQDKIKIAEGEVSENYKYKGKNVIFTIGDGTLTVKNGKGKKITIEETDGKTYTYSVNVAELFEENNFATTANISELVADNFVGELEDISSENLTQHNYAVADSNIKSLLKTREEY